MELPMAAVIGVMFAAGTYMILRPNLIRIVMGFGLYSNATNLLLITVRRLPRGAGPPFVGPDRERGGLMDPLPPDIILTAIVISFAVGSLLLTICYRVYLDHDTDDPEELPVDVATTLRSGVPAVRLPRPDGKDGGEEAIRSPSAKHRGGGSGQLRGDDPPEAEAR